MNFLRGELRSAVEPLENALATKNFKGFVKTRANGFTRYGHASRMNKCAGFDAQSSRGFFQLCLDGCMGPFGKILEGFTQ